MFMNKFLHTRIRVSDLERSIDFYCNLFGFMVYKRNDRSPQGNQIVHLRLPGNEHMLELTWSPDYVVKVPEDLMHTAIGVPNLTASCDRIEKSGIEIWPAGWREIFENPDKRMAFVTDPDGYEVELLERK
jgi:lactoylglutathione lyase